MFTKVYNGRINNTEPAVDDEIKPADEMRLVASQVQCSFRYVFSLKDMTFEIPRLTIKSLHL